MSYKVGDCVVTTVGTGFVTKIYEDPSPDDEYGGAEIQVILEDGQDFYPLPWQVWHCGNRDENIRANR